MGQERITQVVSSLSRVPVDSTKHRDDCVICMEGFKPGDTLTVLKCNPNHYFHNHCIESWVKEGKNTCPICRAPIENFDEIKAMMEGGEFEFSVNSNQSKSNSQNGKMNKMD